MNKIINRKILFLLLFVFALGVALMLWVAHSADKEIREELLVQARIAAQAINIERVSSLSGSEKDLNIPAYQRIKSQLTSMRNARPQCRFLYLMGQRLDGVVFFFVDSLPADSEDYAPPGLVYEEISDSYLRTFKTKQEAVVGPITDRWGTLITALIPLKAPQTENLIAVLGMDVDAKDWNKEILGHCSIPVAAMLLSALSIILMASREQAVKAHRKSEEKHRLFFKNSPIGIIHYDNQGIITDVNEAMITTFASSREKLIGLDIGDIPDKRFAREVYKSLNDEPGYYKGEYTSYTGGKTSFIKANWIPILEDEKVIGGVGIVEDITEQKQAEEDLLKSEKKYRQKSKVLDAVNRVFREALTCESEKDVADTCLSVAENITGSKFGFLGEKNPEGRFNTLSISNPGWDACKMPDSEATRLIQDMEIRGIDRSTIREGKSRIVNDPASHPDHVGTPEGHPPVTSFLGVPLKHAGKTIGMIGLGNKKSGYDLADQRAIEGLSVAFVEALMRKRAEKGLQESEERFRTVADFTYDWESWIDPDGKYIYVSPSFERITGYSPDELLKDHRFLETIIHPDDQEKVEEHLLDHARTHEVMRLDFRIINRNGDTRWITHTCQAVFNSAGEWLGRRGSNWNITEDKKIREQFHQAQKMESVGRLAGGVAHDYNNALSVIIGYTELAMDEVDPTGPLRANLNEVYKAARRATDITRQLLAFARKQTIAPKVLDLNENVEGMLKMLQRLIGENIDLTWLPGTSLWLVKMDPSQIDQILANLCVNARDAISGVGKVAIEARNATFDEAYCADHPGFVPGEFVMLAVSDNGCGIDKEILDNIFEPFFTTKGVDKGTGLGLSTVYGIVKQNNGFINVYSEPGQGTTIKIYLLRHESKAVETQEESTAGIPPGRGETVLVVEDDLSILELARKILDGLGYTVLTAGTMGEAMGLAEEHAGEIHLLVIDVIMPEMNGRELAERLQSLYPDLQRIYMSGYTANIIAHHGVLDKGVYFIQKPFSTRDLATIVREALDE